MRKITIEVYEVSPHKIKDGMPPSQPWMFDFADAIPQILEAKQGGMKMDEMRRVNRIIDAIEYARANNRNFVYIEEEDWVYTRDRVSDNEWPFAHKAFEALADAVINAEQIDLNEKRAAE